MRSYAASLSMRVAETVAPGVLRHRIVRVAGEDGSRRPPCHGDCVRVGDVDTYCWVAVDGVDAGLEVVVRRRQSRERYIVKNGREWRIEERSREVSGRC